MIEFTGNSSDFLKIGVAAAARGDLEAVREILKSRPKWKTRIGSHGRTMLWEACHRGKLEMVKYLVRRKADLNACGTHYTPYFVEISCYCIARHKKHHDVADFLLSKGARFDIHTAAFLGDVSGIRKLLQESRKSINAGHPQYTMARGRKDGVGFVLEAAPWATPLVYAMRGGTLETVKYLIKRGATIQGNEEALFNAADDDYEKIKLLLENGADPTYVGQVFSDEKEMFELLSSYGIKKASNKVVSSELVYLCRGDRGGNPGEVKRLLRMGADVNFQDHKGKTALHRAAKSGFLPAMKVLFEHGATVDIEDHQGETALFDCIRSTIKKIENKKSAILLLLKNGASKTHCNHKSQTPVAVAKLKTRPESTSIIRLLS